MAKVVVALDAARDRTLPSVSVKSGASADGYVPVTADGRKLLLPLTQVEFDKVTYLRHRQRWALWGGVGCMAFGAALARFPLMVPLALVIVALSVVMWVAAWLALKAFLPRIEVEGMNVQLSRVHAGFAAAVRGDS